MYLGDKWEHLFALGDERLRAYGDAPLAAGGIGSSSRATTSGSSDADILGGRAPIA